jgi:pathogenesis-related protein 1
VLNAHNNYRRRHGVHDVKWDWGIQSSAQSWANNCKFQHSYGRYGENLAYTTGGDGWSVMVKMWYDEVRQHLAFCGCGVGSLA